VIWTKEVEIFHLGCPCFVKQLTYFSFLFLLDKEILDKEILRQYPPETHTPRAAAPRRATQRERL
jgi:hypothetical protein